jgi:hypothetical protein
METMLKAIEATGFVDEKQQFHFDTPLPIKLPSRVRVIILVPDDSEIDEREWLYAAAKNPSFAFLREDVEDIYSVSDGKPFNPLPHSQP